MIIIHNSPTLMQVVEMIIFVPGRLVLHFILSPPDYYFAYVFTVGYCALRLDLLLHSTSFIFSHSRFSFYFKLVGSPGKITCLSCSVYVYVFW